MRIIIKKGEISMSDKDEIIELTDKDGNKVKFKIIDAFEKDNEEYAILLPEDSEDEVIIFKVLYSDDDEAEYIEITDDKLADKIFDEFLKRIDEE